MKIRDLLVKPLAITVITVSSAALISCGGGSSGSIGPVSDPVTSSSYAGPGSRWDVTLSSDNTFTITMAESVSTPVIMTITGDYTTLSSGFLKLTVGTVAADAGVGAPSVGDAAYALNVPGYTFVLKPLDSADDQIIPMVTGGECPTTDLDANWVMVKIETGADASGSTEGFYGTFNFDMAAGTPSLPSMYALDQTSLVAGPMTGGTCADGIMLVDGETEMYLTSNGGAIVRIGLNTPDDDTDDNFIFGFAPESLGSISNMAGDYAGLLFDGSQVSGSQITPVSVSCTANGNCTGNMVTDIETNTLSDDTVTINLVTVDNPSDGFITGTIAVSAPGSIMGNMACMANIDAQGTGKNIMSCVGQSPGDAAQMFNVLLVSK